MQTKVILAIVLVALFGLVSAAADHSTLSVLASLNEEHSVMDTVRVAPDQNTPAVLDADHETLADSSSLIAQHQEAQKANDLLNDLIKKLQAQQSADAASVTQKIDDRANSIKSFNNAIDEAKKLSDSLALELAALNKKIDAAKAQITSSTSARDTEQKAIDAENADQRKRLAERIAGIEAQIAMIRKIMAMFAEGIYVEFPESVILGSSAQAGLRSLLKGTAYENSKFKRCYLASANGYSSSAYVQACANNGKGPLLTVIKATTGNIFGGFSQMIVDGSGQYKQDNTGTSFVYSLVRGGEVKPIKVPLVQNGNIAYSIYTNPNYGPTFGGGHDIYVSNACNANQNSYTNFGHTYNSQAATGTAYGSTAAQTFLAGSYNFICADYEVYQVSA